MAESRGRLSWPRRAVDAGRRRADRTPLRVRVVVVVVMLVAIALAGSTVAAIATMRSYLINRVDASLEAVTQHPVAGLARTLAELGGPQRRNDHDAGGGQLPSAYVVEITDAAGKSVFGPTSNLIDSHEPLPELPSSTASDSSSDGPIRFTVDAVRGDEQWRVLATPVRLTNGSRGTLLVAQSLGDVENTVHRLTLLLSVIGLASLAVVGGVGYLVMRLSMRPLRAMQDAAAQIADGDLAHRVPQADARTEVGQLSGALNRMLAEIETAFAERASSEQAAHRSEDRMRRFVADASHELRTPLTSIRGFAELYRQGAVSDEREVVRLMGRIEAEAHRMGLLVDDLLLLARLDQQRPLAAAPVDLLDVVSEAVQAARASATDHDIRMELGSTDPPPIVTGDGQRLRQVFDNLITNATSHTPAGTKVVVRVETDMSSAAVTVSDDGPGMDEHSASRVFERFFRADQVRNSGDGGTGLGLAIVATLVDAHHGEIGVVTKPGEGAAFRVTLPLADTH